MQIEKCKLKNANCQVRGRLRSDGINLQFAILNLQFAIKPRVFVLLLGFVLASPAFAQQLSSAPQSDYQSPAVARPLVIAQGQSSESPNRLPFRLVSAEEPLPAAGGQEPRKLAPRSVAHEPLAKPASPNPINAISTVAASLGIVIGLFLILVWCTRQFAPSGTAALPKEALELLGRAPLGGKHQAQLLRVGNRLLLVALSPAGATTLAEFSESSEVERLIALCRKGHPTSSTAAFRQVLDQISQEPVTGGFAGVVTTSRRGGR